MHRSVLPSNLTDTELGTIFEWLEKALPQVDDLEPLLKGVPDGWSEKQYLDLLRPPLSVKPSSPFDLETIAALAVVDDLLSAQKVAEIVRIASQAGIEAEVEASIRPRFEQELLRLGPKADPDLNDEEYRIFFEDLFDDLFEDYLFFYGLEDKVKWKDLAIERFQLSPANEKILTTFLEEGLNRFSNPLLIFEDFEEEHPRLARFALRMSPLLRQDLETNTRTELDPDEIGAPQDLDKILSPQF